MTCRFIIASLLSICFLLLPVSLGQSGSLTFAQEPPAEEAKPAEEPAEEPSKLIPDPALEAALRAEVYAKRNNTEPLTSDDLKDISRVEAIGKGIENLTGLEHCVSLRLIRLSDNKISDLTPIAGLERLMSIEFENNQIQDIAPLAKLTGIQLINLGGNQVKSLAALEQMTNMRSLWLANNQLESLAPIAGLSKIGSLDVAGNSLEDGQLEPIGKLGWLTHLDLDRNQITSLEALRPLKKLSMILARENKIQDLTPLVEMCRADLEGEKRFAPYLELYLRGNPLSQEALGAQLDQLRSCGVDVLLK